MEAITTFIENMENVLRGIAISVAIIGILGLGMMYMGSSLPLISEWKQSNPKAFRDVSFGLFFLIIGSAGTTGLIGQLFNQ